MQGMVWKKLRRKGAKRVDFDIVFLPLSGKTMDRSPRRSITAPWQKSVGVRVPQAITTIYLFQLISLALML